MGLALALLQLRVAADLRLEMGEEWSWLKTVFPICIKMIEEPLDRNRLITPSQQRWFRCGVTP